ncbi:MarR family transcriptional regulator [Nocardia sp. CDC153]|uniref:MarR family winged helix-turn-helix transcriptional regulator n=1 Tax=Nocardia sp. CDC153 TaxID=3112167 RepID=UPI002DB810E9|nr:MarR family transcriptional regulator [Nocardia sp. CDC153]MEC3956499.1 MarR family transcriptional regulator [Nocardia sp. CDC153]
MRTRPPNSAKPPARESETEERTLPEPTSVADPDQLTEAAELYHTIGRVIRLLRHSGDLGSLSPGAASALATVARSGPLRLGDLANIERVSAPTMSRIVTGLEKSGYLTREADPEDGRAQLLSATEAAHNLVTGLTSARIQRFAAALDHLAPDQRQSLRSALETLIGALEQ